MKNTIVGIFIGFAISAVVTFAIQHKSVSIPSVVSITLQDGERYVGLYNPSGNAADGFTVTHSTHVVIDDMASGGIYKGNAILNVKKQ